MIKANECNFHATLTLKDTFYLSQQYSKNIMLDVSPLTDAFYQLETSLKKFSQNLKIYSDEEELKKLEPVPLIPFTDDQNAFIVDGFIHGKNALKECYEKSKGTLVSLNAGNREQVAAILKNNSLESTPFLSLPFYSLLAFPNLETFETPTNFGSVIEAWIKSPPFLTKENKIIYPTSKVTKQGASVESTPEDFQSHLLCVKRNNIWDLPEKRNVWMSIVPKLKSAVKMLQKLEEPFDTTINAIAGLQRAVKKVTKSLKITVPESFQKVLDFLKTMQNKESWEFSTLAFKDKVYTFIKAALKLTRSFDLDPISFIKMKHTNTKFALPSINNINWRDYLGLDMDTYGVTGPVMVTPDLMMVEDEHTSGSKLLNVHIMARVYNRVRDKIDMYSVTPNVFGNKMTTVKTLVVSKHTKLVTTHTIGHMDCITLETELHKVCHQLPISIADGSAVPELAKCVDALLSKRYSTKFESCPKTNFDNLPYMYRTECGPEKVPTVVINTDQPVQISYFCDGTVTGTDEIDSQLAFIPTDCEVKITEKSGQSLLLPQSIPDMIKDPQVGPIGFPDMPLIPWLTDTELILIYFLGSALLTCLAVLFLFLTWKCCKKCKCKCKRNRPVEPPPLPYPSFLAPLMPMPDLRQIVELREIPTGQ
jgi:hypothetical protein